jgi:hypothetical protein
LFLTYKKALAEGLIYDLIIKKASADQVVTNEAGKMVAVRPGQWQARPPGGPNAASRACGAAKIRW